MHKNVCTLSELATNVKAKIQRFAMDSQQRQALMHMGFHRNSHVIVLKRYGDKVLLSLDNHVFALSSVVLGMIEVVPERV